MSHKKECKVNFLSEFQLCGPSFSFFFDQVLSSICAPHMIHDIQ